MLKNANPAWVSSLFLGATLFALSPVNFAAQQKKTSDPQLQSTMQAIAQTYESFLPLVFDPEKFNAPENEETIKQSINSLERLFEKAEPHFKNSPITFHVSSLVLEDQLEGARTAFDKDLKGYARQKLVGVAGVCSSCHIQDKRSKHLFSNIHRDRFPSDFAYAEFLYLTRDYARASQFYELFIPKANLVRDEENIRIALERILMIHAQLLKDPEKAYDKLTYWYEKHPLPPTVRQDLSQWMAGLKEYIKESGIDKDDIDYNQLDQYMSKHYVAIENQPVPMLADEKEKIFYLMLRGSLHDFLNDNPPQSQIPVVLYWLAVCDRTLSYNFDFSLADWYLKECILEYPNNPFAKKCYSAYEEYVKFAFAGAEEQSIPENVKKELKNLKAKIDNGKV
ncbi:MAG: hypothetical protein U1E78_04130 [Gammaproteobacteria bacterium]